MQPLNYNTNSPFIRSSSNTPTPTLLRLDPATHQPHNNKTTSPTTTIDTTPTHEPGHACCAMRRERCSFALRVNTCASGLIGHGIGVGCGRFGGSGSTRGGTGRGVGCRDACIAKCCDDKHLKFSKVGNAAELLGGEAARAQVLERGAAGGLRERAPLRTVHSSNRRVLALLPTRSRPLALLGLAPAGSVAARPRLRVAPIPNTKKNQFWYGLVLG